MEQSREMRAVNAGRNFERFDVPPIEFKDDRIGEIADRSRGH